MASSFDFRLRSRPQKSRDGRNLRRPSQGAALGGDGVHRAVAPVRMHGLWQASRRHELLFRWLGNVLKATEWRAGIKVEGRDDASNRSRSSRSTS